MTERRPLQQDTSRPIKKIWEYTRRNCLGSYTQTHYTKELWEVKGRSTDSQECPVSKVVGGAKEPESVQEQVRSGQGALI